MAKVLEEHGLQFYVNTEIGSLSAGSAACAGTKDASFVGEYGQVGSYVVLPNGQLLEVTEEAQPDLMQRVRSSYGLFGIIYEVTYKVRPLTPMHVHHKTYTLEEFIAALPELKSQDYSMMFYIFPFVNKITIEFRKYNPGAKGEPNRAVWALRNHTWGKSGPKLANDVQKHFHVRSIRNSIIDTMGAAFRLELETLVKSDYTLPPDQIIHYPAVSDDHRYTFSLFAFPEDDYPAALTDFFKFCKEYDAEKGYRTDLLLVGYRIAQDQKALLSYSYDGYVMTIDPVSTGNPGWNEFLEAYNNFCNARSGKPLLNHTPGLTAEIVQRAFGKRWIEFAELRKKYDPQNRLLNNYYRSLLGGDF